MPRREPELPEGTDHIVRGAAADGGSDVGFVASADPGGSSGTDRLVSQVRDQVTNLRGQAGSRIRGLADDGKSRATGLLDDFSEVIADAAKSVDDKFGEDYGDYAHRAAGAVSSLADRMRTKTVDDLVDDTRDFVRKSPGIALGIAAVAGFALMRVIRTGLDDVGARRGKSDGT
jgi:ElaB/YqjD/DUF883 family membrane-anchored ribosome-binding protein